MDFLYSCGNLPQNTGESAFLEYNGEMEIGMLRRIEKLSGVVKIIGFTMTEVKQGGKLLKWMERMLKKQLI